MPRGSRILGQADTTGFQPGFPEEALDERDRTSETAPVIVPKPRQQPLSVPGKDEVRPGTAVIATCSPVLGLSGSGLDEDIWPTRIHAHSWSVRENHVRDTSVEIAEPPRLASAYLGQNAQQRQGQGGFAPMPIGYDDGGIVLKNRRYCRSDLQPGRRGVNASGLSVPDAEVVPTPVGSGITLRPVRLGVLPQYVES